MQKGASVLEDDIRILSESAVFAAFDGDTIFITGSTGLIGSLFVKGILAWNDVHAGRIRVLALVRNTAKAEAVFGQLLLRDDLRTVLGDAAQLPEIGEPVDWICHGASMTASSDFATKPVEVLRTEIEGTRLALELAREKQVKGFVYLSSLEVYGYADEAAGAISEDYCGQLDRLNPRNSYPCAKRLCECMCASYACEYGVRAKIARLAQTFGAGVAQDDKRIFAYLSQCVTRREDIVLHTDGKGKRCYCYTTDAIEGIVAVLSKGEVGRAYNVANRNTYCSVSEMAHCVAGLYPELGCQVTYDHPADLSSFGYAEPSFMQLDCSRLHRLGWRPRFGLCDMYLRLIASMA